MAVGGGRYIRRIADVLPFRMEGLTVLSDVVSFTQNPNPHHLLRKVERTLWFDFISAVAIIGRRTITPPREFFGQPARNAVVRP